MYWLDNNTGISTAPTPPAVVSLTKKFFTNGGLGEQPSIPEDFWFNMVQEELLGILTLAGIAPVKSDLGQLAKAIQSIAFSAYPVGAPIPWPGVVPPAGFIAMTGQSFSSTTYPKLALAYPTLVLPDMRAEFIRGLDNGRGVDAGRVVLSPQGDALLNHAHNVIGFDRSSAGVNYQLTNEQHPLLGKGFASSDMDYPANAADNGFSNGTGFIKTTFNNSIPTSKVATENRPRNIPFNYIVRAA